MVKCDKCGCPMIVDTSAILLSYPPKYTATCPNCGSTQYPFTDECFKDKMEIITDMEINELLEKGYKEFSPNPTFDEGG